MFIAKHLQVHIINNGSKMLHTYFMSIWAVLVLSIILSPANAENNNADINYYQHIKPVMDKRCVVCHGCYDAPCQLKLSSFDGLQRGAHKNTVYDGSRLLADTPTRLFMDADSTEEWREKDFFPVIQSESTDTKNNLLYQMLLLKNTNPLLDNVSKHNQRLPESAFDLSLNRNDQCPTGNQFSDYAEQHALWGMPYALPALSKKEYNLLRHWLETGADKGIKPQLEPAYQQQVQQWETFFNQPGNKAQLAARYIYEHLFLAHLYFSELPIGSYFKLVRSLTPPGQAIHIIATRRPL